RFAGPEPKLDAAVEVRATERERDSRGARLATSVPRISVVERVAAACLGRLDAELPGVDQIAYAWQAGSTVGIDRRRVRVDPRLPPAPLQGEVLAQADKGERREQEQQRRYPDTGAGREGS